MGMGKAAAVAFAREGAKVVVTARGIPEGEKTVEEIRKSGGEAIFVQADVSKAFDVENLIQRTVETYGRLDCAFNNAAVAPNPFKAKIPDQSPEDFDRVLAINLKGVWLCMKYEIQQMLKQGGGVILNSASVDGFRANTNNTSAYVASKHGVIGLTRTAALEYAKDNIRINVICPGAIRTPMLDYAVSSNPNLAQAFKFLPAGRAGEAEEIAEPVLFLCSDSASYIFGQSLVVDGGLLA